MFTDEPMRPLGVVHTALSNADLILVLNLVHLKIYARLNFFLFFFGLEYNFQGILEPNLAINIFILLYLSISFYFYADDSNKNV